MTPSLYEKDGIVSFYKYDEIEWLIKYKYDKFGHRVFDTIAKLSFGAFESKLKGVYAIPVDDVIYKGFSHTAILAKHLKHTFKPLYDTLHSQNKVRYAGQSLEFRLSNPRNFKYTGPKNVKAVLVDDVTTTGLTLKEAKETLEKNGVEVRFSIVLANLKV